MRNGAREALAILSIHDEYFLRSLRNDLESTLWDYGFALSPDEMKRVREYLGTHSDESDQIIKGLLEDLEPFKRW